LSGGPKTPAVFKVKRTSIADNTVTFSGDDASISLAAKPEDVNYFRDFVDYIVIFQPIAPDDDGETKT
jgi:hypothetical protein